MIARLGLWISRLFRHTVPDPFVLAVLLTVLTVVLALALTPATLPQIVTAWASDAGVWSLLKFAMQMCLILVTGHAVASSPPVARLTSRVARLPNGAGSAAALVAAAACTTAVLNWGLGLIVGAIAAREVGAAMRAKGVRVHYPLLAASGYLGLMVWHGGLSGSAPLKVTKLKDIVEIFGANPPIGPIPLDRTLFSPMNLFITGGLLVIAPLVMYLLAPRDPAAMQPAEEFGIALEAPVIEPPDPGKPWLPRLLEDTPLTSLVLVALIATWAWRYYFPATGPSGARELTPDTVNLTMLIGASVGALVGVTLITFKVLRRDQYLPFGPFLALGAIISMFFHQELLNWYIGFVTRGQ